MLKLERRHFTNKGSHLHGLDRELALSPLLELDVHGGVECPRPVVGRDLSAGPCHLHQQKIIF
jgi:hypothetical protein